MAFDTYWDDRITAAIALPASARTDDVAFAFGGAPANTRPAAGLTCYRSTRTKAGGCSTWGSATATAGPTTQLLCGQSAPGPRRRRLLRSPEYYLDRPVLYHGSDTDRGPGFATVGQVFHVGRIPACSGGRTSSSSSMGEFLRSPRRRHLSGLLCRGWVFPESGRLSLLRQERRDLAAAGRSALGRAAGLLGSSTTLPCSLSAATATSTWLPGTQS